MRAEGIKRDWLFQNLILDMKTYDEKMPKFFLSTVGLLSHPWVG
jgi:hypothetical protein